jgi:hypothetical protein
MSAIGKIVGPQWVTTAPSSIHKAVIAAPTADEIPDSQKKTGTIGARFCCNSPLQWPFA